MKLKGITLGLFAISLLACGSETSIDTETPQDLDTPPELEQPDTNQPTSVAFVSIPGNGAIAPFEMAVSEVTNEQYVVFLNQAYTANKITYNASENMVYDLQNNPMISLGGTRVIKDHNKDGIFELDEMENPLNRCFIQFNAATEQFEMVDPAAVDWNQYFDTTTYPNAVDTIDDWAELNDGNTGFFEAPDAADLSLPTLEEVKKWPVNHIKYYGAEGFAKFYGFDLPTKAQWRLAGQAGQNYEYGTSNGTLSTEVAWYNPTAPHTIWKGHAQPVMSLQANPYGVHDLSGSIWEWCKDWYDGYVIFGGGPKADNDFFIDDTISYDQSVDKYLKCILGGSFNFFYITLKNTHNHAALPHAGNDHFGFRVVKIN